MFSPLLFAFAFWLQSPRSQHSNTGENKNTLKEIPRGFQGNLVASAPSQGLPVVILLSSEESKGIMLWKESLIMLAVSMYHANDNHLNNKCSACNESMCMFTQYSQVGYRP